MRQVVPAAQLRAAHRLAAKFNHEWALAIYDHVDRPEGWTIDEIVEVTRSVRNVYLPPGLECPEVGVDGVIHHTTGTGRLEWSIFPDGDVEIVVNRPQGHVLGATRKADGRFFVTRINPYIPIYVRHVDILHKAFVALGWEGGDLGKAFDIPYLPDVNREELAEYVEGLIAQGYTGYVIVPAILPLRHGEKIIGYEGFSLDCVDFAPPRERNEFVDAIICERLRPKRS